MIMRIRRWLRLRFQIPELVWLQSFQFRIRATDRDGLWITQACRPRVRIIVEPRSQLFCLSPRPNEPLLLRRRQFNCCFAAPALFERINERENTFTILPLLSCHPQVKTPDTCDLPKFLLMFGNTFLFLPLLFLFGLTFDALLLVLNLLDRKSVV